MISLSRLSPLYISLTLIFGACTQAPQTEEKEHEFPIISRANAYLIGPNYEETRQSIEKLQSPECQKFFGGNSDYEIQCALDIIEATRAAGLYALHFLEALERTDRITPEVYEEAERAYVLMMRAVKNLGNYYAVLSESYDEETMLDAQNASNFVLQYSRVVFKVVGKAMEGFDWQNININEIPEIALLALFCGFQKDYIEDFKKRMEEMREIQYLYFTPDLL